MSAVIIEFPKRCRHHDRGPSPGLERTVAETIVLRLVELDRDMAHAVYGVMWDAPCARSSPCLFNEFGDALGRVLGTKVEPSGPLEDAVRRTYDEGDDR
jgi:hypothetical protein